MKILLTGAGGQLGRELQRSLAVLGEVHACDRQALDLADADALRRVVQTVQPQAIVNAAAWTAVDKAETEESAAHAVNATAPGMLAEQARQLGIPLVHYSTDYVFDGSGSQAWRESDTPAPLSAYGRTKLAGEQAIAASGCHHLILRTSWVYGLHGANFLKTMLKIGRERDSLRVIGDQYGVPTWTRHLADLTAVLLARRELPQGVYHAAAAGETTWHGYAEALFAEAVTLGLLARAPAVARITTAEYPLPAPRPANSRLDCSRLRQDTGLQLPDWHTGLRHCLADAVF